MFLSPCRCSCAARVFAAVLVTSVPALASNFAAVQASADSPIGTTIFNTTVASGPANSNVSGTWTCNTCSGFTASGAGKADFGVLGSMVDLNVPGPVPNGFSVLAESISHFNDDLTITGGTGAGVLELQFAVTGSATPFGTGQLALCDSRGCGDPNVFFTVNSGTLTSESSFQPNFISNATIAFYIPFTYGTALSIEPQLSTSAQFFSCSSGCPSTPFDANANYNDTAIISAALVRTGTTNSPGTVVTGASIADGDGFTFGPNGLTAPSAVPEPACWFLSVSAIAALMLTRRRALRRPGRTSAV